MRCVDTVNSVCPGRGLTPLVEKQIADMATERRISRDDAALALLGESNRLETSSIRNSSAVPLRSCACQQSTRSPALPSLSMAHELLSSETLPAPIRKMEAVL
jgi:hypothetical protein